MRTTRTGGSGRVHFAGTAPADVLHRGYTDLLLGESVGILGALQRKFVERVKSSTERISNLINDLIQVTTLERD
jgi:signal transduction histidine kinase